MATRAHHAPRALLFTGVCWHRHSSRARGEYMQDTPHLQMHQGETLNTSWPALGEEKPWRTRRPQRAPQRPSGPSRPPQGPTGLIRPCKTPQKPTEPHTASQGPAQPKMAPQGTHRAHEGPQSPPRPFRAQQGPTEPQRASQDLTSPTQASHRSHETPPGHDYGYDDDADCAYYDDYMSYYD